MGLGESWGNSWDWLKGYCSEKLKVLGEDCLLGFGQSLTVGRHGRSYLDDPWLRRREVDQILTLRPVFMSGQVKQSVSF